MRELVEDRMRDKETHRSGYKLYKTSPFESITLTAQTHSEGCPPDIAPVQLDQNIVRFELHRAQFILQSP